MPTDGCDMKETKRRGADDPHPLQAMAAIAIAVIIVVCGCSKGGGDEIRDGEQEERLSLLSGMITAGNPMVTSAADSMLRIVEDSFDYYEIVLMKSNYYQLTSHLDTAIIYARQAYQFAYRQEESPRRDALMGLSLSSQAACRHIRHADAEGSVEEYERAYELVRRSGEADRLPDMAANLGDAYLFDDDLLNAAKWYRKAITLSDSLGMPPSNSLSLYMGLGGIYMRIEDYATAETYFEKTMERMDEMGLTMQCYFLNNYGNLYYYTGRYEESLAMFRRLYSLLQSNRRDDNYEMLTCKLNMADVFLNLGETDSAQAYLAQVEPFIEENQLETYAYYFNTVMICIATRNGDYKKVEEIIGGEHYSHDIEWSLRSIRDRYMEQYYVAIGEERKARLLREGIERESDSVKLHNQYLRTAEIIARLSEDTLRLHHEVEIREMDKAVSRWRAMVGFVALLAVILLLVMAYLALWTRKSQLQARMEMMRTRLERVRQRITPHFIFNILNAQAGKGADADKQIEKVARLIRENITLTGKSYVSVDEELQFVRQYVELQQELMGNTLHFTVDISPADAPTQQIMIPSMAVQILAENAIKHALKDKAGEKVLAISVVAGDKETVVEVRDNGTGFDIRRSSSGTKSGLNIIRQTIAIVNRGNKRKKMRLDITNIPDGKGGVKGCSVKLTIPKGMVLAEY